jgi:hypothetical protein
MLAAAATVMSLVIGILGALKKALRQSNGAISGRLVQRKKRE